MKILLESSSVGPTNANARRSVGWWFWKSGTNESRGRRAPSPFPNEAGEAGRRGGLVCLHSLFFCSWASVLRILQFNTNNPFHHLRLLDGGFLGRGVFEIYFPFKPLPPPAAAAPRRRQRFTHPRQDKTKYNDAQIRTQYGFSIAYSHQQFDFWVRAAPFDTNIEISPRPASNFRLHPGLFSLHFLAQEVSGLAQHC